MMFKKCLPTFGNIVKIRNSIPIQSISINRKYAIYEPDYLESLKPKYPQYQCINFKLKGYDFPILENYQKFLHNVAEYLNLDVSECYALPPKHSQIQRFKPSSAIIDAEYKLITYERILQVTDMEAPKYPLFLRIAQSALPEGVILNVEQNTDDQEDIRYVPNRDLVDLRSQLENIQSGAPSPSTKKK